MIVLDYSPFANNKNKYFSSLNETHKYEKARFQKVIFEEVHMFESVDILCNDGKQPWSFDTVFLWKGGSLEAGNVELAGLPVNQLLIRRRKADEHTFEYIKSFSFDPDVQFYEFQDRFIESYEDYVYGIQPAGGSVESPIRGDTTIAKVETEFNSVWIVGKDTQYKLMYNLQMGDYQGVIPNNVQETLGSQFPIVQQSGNVNYNRGTIQAMLVSDGSLQGSINPKTEKLLRRAIMSFLTDGKPKFLKAGNGDVMTVAILGKPTLSPNNNLNQLLFNISLEYVEVAGTSPTDLINSGLLEEVR